MEWLFIWQVKNEDVSCRFCGGEDTDGHWFWDCPWHPLVHILENLSLQHSWHKTRVSGSVASCGTVCSLSLLTVLEYRHGLFPHLTLWMPGWKLAVVEIRLILALSGTTI